MEQAWIDPDERMCEVCGCTEDNACVSQDGEACSWASENLCSFCDDGTLGRQSREPVVGLYTEGDLNAVVREMRGRYY